MFGLDIFLNDDWSWIWRLNLWHSEGYIKSLALRINAIIRRHWRRFDTWYILRGIFDHVVVVVVVVVDIGADEWSVFWSC